MCLFACLAVVPRLRDEGGCSFVVKKNWRFKFGEARQRFRLTPTEIRVAAFVVAAFALGLITKCYRDAHQSPSLPQPNKTRTKFASPAPASTPARKRTGKARKQSPQPSSVAHVQETLESDRQKVLVRLFSAPRFVDCQLRLRLDKMKRTTKSQKMDEAFSIKQDDRGHLVLLRR